MAKANGEDVIKECMSFLAQGKTYADAVSVICGKFRFSDRTFDKYWKIAQERHSETQKAAQLAMADQYIQSALQGQQAGILTKQERMRLASGIACNKEAQDSDRLKAMDYLSKIEGDYAPAKTEHSGSITGLTDDQFERTLKAAREQAKANTGK